eukprot:11830769-Alexandrium_andersonii.AAC.1
MQAPSPSGRRERAQPVPRSPRQRRCSARSVHASRALPRARPRSLRPRQSPMTTGCWSPPSPLSHPGRAGCR